MTTANKTHSLKWNEICFKEIIVEVLLKSKRA